MAQARFRILALFGADHNNAAAAETAKAADNRLVIGEGAIACKRCEVVNEPGGDVVEFRPVHMAGYLRFLPRRQLCIGLFKLLQGFLAEFGNILFDLNIAAILKPFQLADFAFQISNRLLKIKEIIHKPSRLHTSSMD